MGVSFDLTGKVALVTGAGRGLGFEIARAFAAGGARVYLNGSNAERLQVAIDKLAAEGLTAYPAAFDVSDEAAADAAVDHIFAEAGRLDILVNNVGVRMRNPLDQIAGADLAAMLNTNLVAAFSLSKRAAGLMVRGGYGRIINISSIASERGRKDDAAYIIAKGAMNSLTRVLAAEFGAHGITCNAILPGTFATETNAPGLKNEGVVAWLKARVPLQRAGEPSEIAGAAVFLASAAGGFVTGISLPVDGGYLSAA